MKKPNIVEMATMGLTSGCIVLVLLALILLPLAAIWSVNTLFAFSIPWTLKTWAAALVLIVCVHDNSSSSSK